MGLKIGDGIVEDCIPGVNGCMVDKSFNPKGEAKAIFRVVLGSHGDVNLPSTEEELQTCKDCLQFGAGCDKFDLFAVKRHLKSIWCFCQITIAC